MRRPTSLPPVIDKVSGLRQRQRADGSWRVWWEPTAAQRAAGSKPVELNADNPGAAARQAQTLTRKAEAARKGEAKAAPVAAFSVSACIQDYLQSLRFEKLRDSTKASYRVDLRAIEAKWGPQSIVLFDAPVIDTWYEALYREKGPFRAIALVRMFSIVFRHAEKRGWRPKGSNPCRDLDVERPKARSRVGTWAELDACLMAARRLGLRSMRLALLLAIFTGQRQTDLRLAAPNDFQPVELPILGTDQTRRVWVWRLIRSKRGNEGTIPLHPEVVPALRVARLIARGDRLIWDEATGQPYSKRLWFDRWEAIRALAAKSEPSVADLQWRDLRRTFGHLSRRGGASKSDVADVLGNTAATNAALAEVYMAAQLETTARAVGAITRPVKSERKKA
ncbi:tyrosine-type recombinase/integrase [Cereibacter azotoformans]|uniref:tyrosine-type recombinase/integrase n=1 Tax=Cereibacter azotoformans TaxID=43057 RepID=UPI000C6CCCD6|nr:hypothetical protein [Cereibacter azotoformans]